MLMTRKFYLMMLIFVTFLFCTQACVAVKESNLEPTPLAASIAQITQIPSISAPITHTPRLMVTPTLTLTSTPSPEPTPIPMETSITEPDPELLMRWQLPIQSHLLLESMCQIIEETALDYQAGEISSVEILMNPA